MEKNCQTIIRICYSMHIYILMSNNIRIFKGAGCPELDKETLTILLKFLKYATGYLKLQDKPIKIRLLCSSPQEPITTGAYTPADKTISTIVQGRNLIDYCRTIAHELTHMRQDYDGKLNEIHPEIGGDIEDDANSTSGRIIKFFIKNILTKEEKTKIGVGTYGD